jgi:AcrR family transcriptional regulator
MTERGPGRPRASSHDEIREIATSLFERQGYAATSLEQIAQAAGISRTTLFAYFPAKRDLVWEELTERVAEVGPALGAADDRPLVDVIVDLFVRLAQFPAADRAVLIRRWRIVQADDDLRAYAGLQNAELARLVVAEALRRDPDRDIRLVDHVTRAMLAVAVRSREEWSEGGGEKQDLAEYTAEQLNPIADGLRPLLA